MTAFETEPDPSLAALCYHFGRYLLISSSRPGTEAANLQGIWNENMNPSWDSKYTANINLQMNYWPVESGNLSDCAEPLTRLVKELTNQGSQVAKEHYGAKGWVFHQNTDIWRVAAPMDGPTWGTFTVGGAWLCNQLWDHYLYTLDRNYLKEIYPVIKGSVEFFMDFLVPHPNGKWLVTNPSNSPENPPKGPGYHYFFDEVTGSYYFTTICYGSSMDMQILTDLFGYFAEASRTLGVDKKLAAKVAAARAQPAGMGRGLWANGGQAPAFFAHVWPLPGQCAVGPEDPAICGGHQSGPRTARRRRHRFLPRVENVALGPALRWRQGQPDLQGLHQRAGVSAAFCQMLHPVAGGRVAGRCRRDH
jgi:alpha-L-fucosidase 2